MTPLLRDLPRSRRGKVVALYCVGCIYSYISLFQCICKHAERCKPMNQNRDGVIEPISSVPLFSRIVQLYCGDAYQNWMWFKEFNMYFREIMILLTEKLTNSHPSSRTLWHVCWVRCQISSWLENYRELCAIEMLEDVEMVSNEMHHLFVINATA